MTSRRSFRLAAFACAAGLAGVACGGASGGEESSVDTAAPVTEPAPSATEAPSGGSRDADVASDADLLVPASLQFTAPLIGGGEIVGDELAGKPTAFWFWSPT